MINTKQINLSKVLRLLKGILSLKTLILLLFCLFFSFKSFSQYAVSGNNHTEIKYSQIKTKDFQIVFPNYYEPQAQELARILDTLLPNVSNSLLTFAPNVPILLHPSSAKSNGLAVWAPKRMEFWSSPSMDNYAYPFLWQLAIHEYRHSAQMQAMNVGLTKFLGKIFGEHILGAVCGVWIPYWFMEGDAVVAETSLAPTGRGQSPEYNMYFKSLVQSNRNYSTDKMLLGSMKNFVLSEYNLGYFMVSVAREKYGKDIWGHCLNDIGKNWIKLHSFGQTAIKNVKLNFDNLYNETVSFMQEEWDRQDKDFLPRQDSAFKWNKDKDYYSNYKNPVQINDTTILALKTSNYEPQQLVKITPSKEEKLLKLPYLENSYFDYKDSCILYAQYSPNVRWQEESHSDIIEYDLRKDKYRRVTSDAVLFNPIYFPLDSVMAAIETDSVDKQNLSIIAPDAKFFKNRVFKEKIQSSYLKNKYCSNSYSFSYPAWEQTSGDIFLVSTTQSGKQILRYHRITEEFEEITSPSYDDITKLKVFNNRLYFIKDVRNRYQLLSFDIDNTNDVQIHTSERYGIDSYFIYDSTIVVSTYTANGYDVVSLPYTSKAWNLNETSPLLSTTINNQKQENFILQQSMFDKDTTFEVRKYNKFLHSFNFHSWAPLFVNVEAQELGLGISVMSQNLLSTSVLTAGFNYNLHEKNLFYLHYTYTGLYPKIDANLNFKPRDVRKDLDSNAVQYLNFDELSIVWNLTLPFTWTNRNFYNNISLGVHYSLTDIFNDDDKAPITLFNSIGYSITASNFSEKALNDLYPRWGHITKAKYLKTLTSDKAHVLAFSSQVFFPGFFRNHSLSLTACLQYNTPEVYYFPNEINFVRGLYSMYPEKYYGLLAMYALPLIYPDGGIKHILYIKRITTTPFYNIGMYDKKIFRSFGADIMMKANLFRITLPLDLGVRVGYQRETEKLFASFLFSINM